ncbi:hypothetical protein RRU94_19490 [Domibacillus sp. DTU_2020_1001157_1_SI_ALB_TIR_016]|uniref:hypothetical protein n=1 Tax=Domibacillus sp. DTU_2020_1001157_1_SI_ALB_TIR_016 TaxID=3077789 RepID=UPI0028EBD8A0|nr:hypothetical protein [Domibacillus sp. DTU_2020_1001157_1_SI_ALB_TIR_016]WNS79703.1 hypothetical protein RRU94_19490 [Domibacillus sp. DTU_2020_1001157_1_SI_ALB_TIR_016]
MDFKSIEMQVALPRTFEGAKPAQDRQQPFFVAQQHIQHKAVKEMKGKGTVAAGSHQSNQTGGQGGEEQQNKQKKKKEIRRRWDMPILIKGSRSTLAGKRDV